jgi:SAM-dependent methyltransferase
VPADAARAKWDRIYSGLLASAPEPAAVLAENAHLLPPSGDALDLACGLGGNALLLARLGFKVSAWDVSKVAVDALAARAARLGLGIAAQARDVEAEPFPVAAFDVVVASRFLARPLARPILDSLKPQGLLFYQTYTRDKPGPQGPGNPDYLLAENELLRLFAGLRVLVYREEGRVGDLSIGRRDEAYFVGRKRLFSDC